MTTLKVCLEYQLKLKFLGCYILLTFRKLVNKFIDFSENEKSNLKFLNLNQSSKRSICFNALMSRDFKALVFSKEGYGTSFEGLST